MSPIMKQIELNEKMVGLLKKKISETDDGYIHILIRNKKIVFIGFEKKYSITRLDEENDC